MPLCNGARLPVLNRFMGYLINFVAITLLFMGCKKEGNALGKFVGKWEYEQHKGFPFTNTYLPPGNGNLIVLMQDGRYERMRGDSLVFKGSYLIFNKEDCSPRNNKQFFTTGDSYSTDQYIVIENNRVTLTTPNCLADGGTTYYRRLPPVGE